MKFGIITDPHLGANSIFQGSVRIWGENAPENILRALRALQVHEDLRFIVNLGDSIEESKDGNAEIDRSRFAAVREAFSACTTPVYHLIGNHDSVNFTAEQAASMLGMPGTHFSFEAAGYTGIALYCPSVDHNFPTLETKQLAFLADTLASAKSDVLLFIHHALAEHSLDQNFWFKGKPGKAFVKNRADILKILSDSKKVRAVFNGHLHASNCTSISGIPFFSIQSLSQAVEPELLAAHAYAIVEVDDDFVTVSILGNEPHVYRAKRY